MISSTSTKAVVCAGSVGGRVWQTRGVTCSAPNCTVSSTITSKVMVRPVILSRPVNSATGLLIGAARAGAQAPRQTQGAKTMPRVARVPHQAAALAALKRGPRLVVAADLRALRRTEDRALRLVGRRRAGEVRQVRFLPFARLVGIVGRRNIGAVVHPAVPGGRDARGFRLAVVDDPAAVAVLLPVIAVAELVAADEFARPPGPEAGAECRAVPPGEKLQQELLHGHSGLQALNSVAVRD